MGLSAFGAWRGGGLITWGKGGYAEFSVSTGGLGEVSRVLCAFVRGVTSPLGAGRISSCISPSSQLVKLAKRLKKEKVNVDIINFGEEVSKD